jgi:hypothetical protein
VFWQCEVIPYIYPMICPCAAFVSLLVHLDFQSYQSKWHFVVIKRSAEMCKCQNIGGGIRLPHEIDCDLGLWEQLIPKVWWKVVGYTGQDPEKMGFKVAYGYLGCIALVASQWYQFHVKIACVMDVIFHVF